MKALEKSRPKISVLDFSMDQLLNLVRNEIKKHHRVIAAYLFGSCARGDKGPWSDLDILIVTETDGVFLERPLQFESLFDLDLPVDVLVYTPEEFKQLSAQGTGFWKTFNESNIQII